MAKALIEYLPFPNKDGSAASRAWNTAMKNEWEARCKKAKEAGIEEPIFEPTNLYQLRKYLLSQWAAAGISDDVVKDLAGHSDIALTKNVYIGVDKGRLLIAKQTVSLSIEI